MPRQPVVPTYRRHSSGQARATLYCIVTGRRRDVLLGKHGSQESVVEYARVIAAWEAAGRRLEAERPADERYDLTINELLLRYLQYAETIYRHADGTPTGTATNLKYAFRPLREFYGMERAADFGPLKLKAVRQHFINANVARKQINARISRIRAAFKWAVGEELLPSATWEALRAVDGLRYGRGGKETKGVGPVPMATVEATLQFLNGPVAAIVRLLMLTGARFGEIAVMRTCDIDTSGRVWIYRPRQHKTTHHGKTREIYLGPRAQEVLKPWLKLDLQANLFNPAEAEDTRNARRGLERVTPRYPSHMRNNAKRKIGEGRTRPPRDFYDRWATAHAIHRACDKAFPAPEPLGQRDDESVRKWLARLTPEQRVELKAWQRSQRWHLHQLRHLAGTLLRKEHGIELARIILGHSKISMTEHYAESDRAAALDLVNKIG